MSEITALKLPESTPFPVKIFSIDINKNDNIQKHQQILRYSYWEFQDAPIDPSNESPDNGDSTYKPKKKVRVDLVGSFESPLVGIVQDILVSKGEEILSPDHEIAKILEPCTHSIQYSGLCALCGKSLEEEQDYSGYKYEDRATISMSHGTSNLKISKDEAEKVEEIWTKTLIKDKKLILVVDLDQTVIHAAVDPTINDWMRDPTNPNYPSLKDVQTFSLEEEPIVPPNYQGPKLPTHTRWYYVKSRPGLGSFLETVSQKYELHIYTMGTRAYAKKIANCIDPDGKYFADRILSRDESGSMTQKTLERLFPTDTSMVVIIDDRGDVWNWSDHLIKVVPFDFFVGIGDINSSFLPRQKSLLGPTKRRGSIGKLQEQLAEGEVLPPNIINQKDRTAEELERKIEEIKEEEQTVQSAETSALTEELNAELMAVRDSEREASLDAQKEERPMEKLQKDLDKLGGSEGKIERLLYDDDDELTGLEKALIDIHTRFYDIYEKDNVVPDIKYLLPSIKLKVFEGLEFVFSGLFPLGSNIHNENIVIWAKSFGARIKTDLTLETTHIVTKSPHTYKARLAKSMLPNVKIVHPNWVFDSLSNWGRSEESDFEITIDKDRLLGQEEVDKYKQRLRDLKENKARVNEAVVSTETDQYDGDNLLGGDLNWLDMNEEDEEFFDSEEESEDDTGSKKRSVEDESEEESSKRRKADDFGEDDEDELAAELMLDLDDGDDNDDDNE